MIQGVIFDIDGIIVDSEALHMEALGAAIQKELKLNVDEQAQDLIGLTLDATIARFGIPGKQVAKIKERTIEYYVANLKADLIRPKMKRLWQALIAKNIKFGCVSSAEMKICQSNINLLELSDRKEVPIVAFESVTISKPHPMPYLTMLDLLGLGADEVIVLEDSDTGIRSAAAAGIANVYAWPHRLSNTQKYHQAKQVIADLAEVDFFRSLMA